MYYYLESNTFLESIEYNTDYEITDGRYNSIIRFNLDTGMFRDITIYDGSARLGSAYFLGVCNSSTFFEMEPEKLVVVLYIKDGATYKNVLKQGFRSLFGYGNDYLYRIEKGEE